MRALLCMLGLICLCGCNTTLAKLNLIRSERMPAVERQMAALKLKPGSPVYLRIFKAESQLEAWVYNDYTGVYTLYKTYPVCSWSGGLGPKLREGDRQSPEGFYEVSEEWLWPASKYHLAMNIGFPNEFDRSLGRTGSALMIHGGCESEGCYAMTNPAIEEIYLLTEQSLYAGNAYVPVHIFPFRMTPENMARYAGAPWTPFWQNLKEGYDLFEQSHIPPMVEARNRRYTFAPQIFRYAGGV